jgi:hypothetical protein
LSKEPAWKKLAGAGRDIGDVTALKKAERELEDSRS